MSDVMRYDLDVGDEETRACMTPADGGDFVQSEDFDRVVAERDALQQRLNAADQRIDELERGDTAPLDPPQPITEQYLEDHLGKRPQ